MNIREFTAIAAEEILEYLPEEMQGEITVQPTEIMKINDQVLHGLSFHVGEDPAPTYYINELYEMYSGGADRRGLLQHLAMEYLNGTVEAPKPEEIPDMDFNAVKRKAGLRLIGKDYNRKFLRTVPYRDMGNGYALIYEIQVGASDGGIFSTVVTNKLAADYNYDLDRLYQFAMDHAWRSNAASLTPVGEIMNEYEWDKGPETCYVLTTKRQHYGAAALFYPGTQAMIAHVLEEDYLALPSSLHEFIIVRESRVKDPAHLLEMVRQANRTIVAPSDVLSDNVLRYSKSTGELSLAGEFSGCGHIGCECVG